MKALISCVFGSLLASVTGVASAHHSFSSFDMAKSVEITGVVREFRWQNPHSWILLETMDASGQPVDATLETNGPGYLVRTGWKRETLRPGDKITATIHPMRDGSPGGNLISVTLPSGETKSALPAGPRAVTSSEQGADENKNAK